MNKTMIICPECGYKQEIEIPQDRCLPFYRCNGCGKIISVPKNSKECCVICAYSAQKCPVGKIRK